MCTSPNTQSKSFLFCNIWYHCGHCHYSALNRKPENTVLMPISDLALSVAANLMEGCSFCSFS